MLTNCRVALCGGCEAARRNAKATVYTSDTSVWLCNTRFRKGTVARTFCRMGGSETFQSGRARRTFSRRTFSRCCRSFYTCACLNGFAPFANGAKTRFSSCGGSFLTAKGFITRPRRRACANTRDTYRTTTTYRAYTTDTCTTRTYRRRFETP